MIVSSFGYEALASHKHFRILADQLARAGFPVLRFDFPGTGDSAGDETDFDLVETRSMAVSNACRFMRATTSVGHITLLGFRLGATIASLVCAESLADSLVLIEPAVTGRMWLREQDLLPLLSGIAADEQHSKDETSDREYMGYPMNAASHASIRSLDMRTIKPIPASRCLIMAGQVTGPLEQCISNWQSDGAIVEQADFDGFPAMMTDPAIASPVIDAFLPLFSWLGAADIASRRMPSIVDEAIIVGKGYRERSTYFGAAENSFGVLCEPDCAVVKSPVLILPNTGGNPHTGWGRQSVELARYLASLGIASFRIDVNGIGETPDMDGRPQRLVYVPDSREDVKAAIDFLHANGFCRIGVAGICSGAYLAYQASLCDPRISALQLINLQKFEWQESDQLVLYRSIGFYFSMLTSAGIWSRIRNGDVDVAGVFHHIMKKLFAKTKTRFRRAVSRILPSGHLESASPLSHLKAHLEKGMHVSIVYTRGDGGIDEAETCLGREGRYLSRFDRFTMQTSLDAGHNFGTGADRIKLMQVIGAFARQWSQATPYSTGQPELSTSLMPVGPALRQVLAGGPLSTEAGTNA